MNTRRRYTEHEDGIIKRTYPGHGSDATAEALRGFGYARSRKSIVQRAFVLGIKAGVNPRGDLPGAWSENEDAIIDNKLPPRKAKKWLAAAGFARTEREIAGRRRRLGESRTNEGRP